MEACLEEDLPPTTELEEGLRNGVYLGKLATFFAPKMVSEKRIYDRDQSRYKVCDLYSLDVRLVGHRREREQDLKSRKTGSCVSQNQ